MSSTVNRMLGDDEEWTVGSVKSVIATYAERTGKSFEPLLEEMEESARRTQEGTAEAMRPHDPEGALDRLKRERLLPEGKTLEKIARYEAHISRQMYQALHELEALQTRRAGGVAPLGRLDVQGDSET